MISFSWGVWLALVTLDTTFSILVKVCDLGDAIKTKVFTPKP